MLKCYTRPKRNLREIYGQRCLHDELYIHTDRRHGQWVDVVLDEWIEGETLPGATALIPALVQSGFPCDRFCFEGFLPQKKGRMKQLQALAGEERTMIFYESPYRVVRCLSLIHI